MRQLPGSDEPLELRLYTASTDPDGIKAAPFIQGWLGELGIDVTLRSMTDAKLYDVWLGSLDWDLIIYSWGVGPDPDFILSSFTSRQCGFWSDTCYSNPEYDELYKLQQTTIDEAARQQVVSGDAADHLPRHAGDRAVVPEHVRGVAVGPMDGVRSVARARRRRRSGGTTTRRGRSGPSRTRRC